MSRRIGQVSDTVRHTSEAADRVLAAAGDLLRQSELLMMSVDDFLAALRAA